MKSEYLESEIVFETDKISGDVEPKARILSCTDKMEKSELITCEKERLCCNASAASAGVLRGAGDHYLQDGCSHDDLEVESQVVAKDKVGVDKNGIAAVQSKRHENENENEDEVKMEDKKEHADAFGGKGKGRAVEEGELSMLSNGRIEFITPSVNRTHSRPSGALAKSDQKTVTTSSSSDTPFEPVKNTVLDALKSVPKGPGQGPRGWVVPTKKNFIPGKIVMSLKISSVLVKESDRNGGGGDGDEKEEEKEKGEEKEKEKEIEIEIEKGDKFDVYKSTAHRVVVVKRLHSAVSKPLIAPVPVPVVVTAVSLLAGSGKLQVSFTLPLFFLLINFYLYTYLLCLCLYLYLYLFVDDNREMNFPILHSLACYFIKIPYSITPNRVYCRF